MISAGRRQLLKDFLENDPSHLNIVNNRKPRISKRSISRGSKAASTAVSAIHRAFNAIKRFHFNLIKSPSKMSRITCSDISVEVSAVRSFRNLMENVTPPSDCYDSETQCSGTSLPEEDELSRENTKQDSPVSILNFQFQEVGKHVLPSHQCFANMETSSFDNSGSTTDSITGRKNMLMHSTQNFEYLPRIEFIEADNTEKVFPEKKHHEEGGFETKLHAAKHFNHAQIDEIALNLLFLDFFHNELTTSANEDVFESNLRTAKAWISGGVKEKSEWEVRGKKISSVREMDKGGSWSKFAEEKQELAFEVELEVSDCLLDELLIDLFTVFF